MFTLALIATGFAAEELRLPAPASLVWAPEVGTELDYRFATDLGVAPRAIDLPRIQADGATVSFRTQLDLRCTAVDGGATGLDCVVYDVKLASPDEGVELQRRVDAAQSSLLDARVRVDMARSGRVRSVDVHSDLWVGPEQSLARLVVERSVAGLDLELPGAVSGPTAWMQTRSAFLPTSSATGPLGRIELYHHVSSLASAAVRVESVGQLWWLDTGLGLEGEERTTGRLASVALIDRERGVILRRDWATHGQELPLQQSGSVELRQR